MPKLKKHSQLQTRQTQQQTKRDVKYEAQTEVEDSHQNDSIQIPVRMKYSDRIKTFEKPSSRKKSNRAKKQPRVSPEVKQKSPQLKEDSNINIFLNKYTDDDDIDQSDQIVKIGRRKSKKQAKPEIKTKNKMFSNVDFDEKLDQQRNEQYQQLEITCQKRQQRQSGRFLDKFQKKAETYKNKLEYKELNKDHKYKKNIQNKLKEIKEVEQVNIQVEVPKIFTGSRPEVQAAIFLKNAGNSTQDIHDKTQKQLEQVSGCMDRKMYFDDLGKQLRMKKTQTLTQSVLKERFKKSMLDDQDYIDDFEDRNGDSFSRRQEYSRPIKLKDKSRQKSIEKIQESGKDIKENKITKTSSIDSKGETRNLKKSRNTSRDSIDTQSLPPVNQENIKETQESKNKEGASQKDKDSNPIIYRKKQQPVNIKKKIKNFKFSSLIQVEAQVSDDEQQGGPKHNDQLDSDEDQDDLDSLIDHNAQNDQNDRYILQRKFVADMLEEQQRKYEEMKKKIQKKYIQEEEMIKKRMQAAARKNSKRDQQQDILYYADKILEDQSVSEATSKSTTMKGNQEEKMKQFEEMLGNDKKKKQIENPKLGIATGANSLQSLEKSLFGGGTKGQKVERQGLRNANVHRKPAVVKGKK